MPAKSTSATANADDVDMLVDVAGRLRFAAARLVRQLRRQDEGGLSATQTAALATIVRDGPLSLGALAANEGLSKPSITKVVEKLESLGLIVRKIDADDRRVCHVVATARGQRQLDANRARRTAYLVQRIAALEPEDRVRLAAAVDVLESLLEEPQAHDTDARAHRPSRRPGVEDPR